MLRSERRERLEAWAASDSPISHSQYQGCVRPTAMRLDLQLDIIVPVLMSCALLWWVSRDMNWTARLVVAAVTLVVIIVVVLFERSGVYVIPGRE